MRILVCTDGSKQSRKAIEEAVKIAGGCNVNEVAVIHVYEAIQDRPPWYGSEGYRFSREELESYKKMGEQEIEKKKEMLSEAKRFFAENNIEVKTILKEGHPAHTIAEVADDEGYDMIVIGSRGLGGLKRLFLGSVSNAVLQGAKANVLVVK